MCRPQHRKTQLWRRRVAWHWRRRQRWRNTETRRNGILHSHAPAHQLRLAATGSTAAHERQRRCPLKHRCVHAPAPPQAILHSPVGADKKTYAIVYGGSSQATNPRRLIKPGNNGGTQSVSVMHPSQQRDSTPGSILNRRTDAA